MLSKCNLCRYHVDVVYAIAGFGVCSSLLPGMSSWGGAAEAAWRSPLQLAVGVVGGVVHVESQC